MTEKWLPVPSLGGRYEANANGCIRNSKTKRILKGSLNKDGYRLVCLQDDEAKHGHRNYLVHRLVAEAFHGPCPDGQQVRHYPDRNPDNNRPDNLRYGTGSQNILDAVEHGTHNWARKTHCPQNHEYNEKNTRYNLNGSRSCRICIRESERKSKQKESSKRRRRERRNPAAHDPDLLTTGDAAEFLGCSRGTITNLCLRGELSFVQVGSHRRIRRQDLLALLPSSRLPQ